MKYAAACIAFVLVAGPLSARAQQADPFNGTWKLNVAKSQAMWQTQKQPKAANPQSQSSEVISMNIANGALQYQVEYAKGNKASFTGKFNDAQWQNFRGDAEGGVAAATLVKINDHLHYWVTRTKDGQFGGLIH